MTRFHKKLSTMSPESSHCNLVMAQCVLTTSCVWLVSLGAARTRISHRLRDYTASDSGEVCFCYVCSVAEVNYCLTQCTQCVTAVPGPALIVARQSQEGLLGHCRVRDSSWELQNTTPPIPITTLPLPRTLAPVKLLPPGTIFQVPPNPVARCLYQKQLIMLRELIFIFIDIVWTTQVYCCDCWQKVVYTLVHLHSLSGEITASLFMLFPTLVIITLWHWQTNKTLWLSTQQALASRDTPVLVIL